jgi:hypothetical protein
MGTTCDSLRLVLISLNELEQVAVVAPGESFTPRLFSLGVVKGKTHLKELLETAQVDHYVVTYGEPFATTFRSSPFAHSADEIVDSLEKSFQEIGGLLTKLRAAQGLSDQEQAQLRFAPRAWMVWSSSLETKDGLERARSWFRANQASSNSSQRPEKKNTEAGQVVPPPLVPLSGKSG